MKKILKWIAKIENKKIFGISVISKTNVDIFTFIIIISALLMGYEVGNPSHFLEAIQKIILHIFLLELILRGIIAYINKEFKRHIVDPWTIFDIIVIGAGFVPSSFQKISNILRIFRVFRILRVIKAFPNIKLIVSIIIRCLPRMGIIALLLVILIYVYSIIGIELFGSHQKNFSSFKESFFTLFVELTGEGWNNIRNEAVNQHGYLAPTIYHVSWILISSFLVLNLFIGVILDSFSSLSEFETTKRKFLELKQTHKYTLVLGWNEDIKILLKNFILSNRSLNRSTMVIMSDQEFDKMETYIQYEVYTDFEDNKIYTDIIVRQGNCTNAHDISLVLNEYCEKIILLPEETLVRDEKKQLEHDLNVIDILTNLSGVLKDKNLQLPDIIAPYYNTIPDPFPKQAQMIPFAKVTKFHPILLTSKILSQLTLSKNSYFVIEQLFSFNGCEVYLNKVSQKRGTDNIRKVLGKKIKDIQHHFHPSILLGWIELKENKEKIFFCHAHPEKLDYTLKEGDQLIILAEDDSQIAFSRFHKKLEDSINLNIPANALDILENQHLLIMGWGPIVKKYLAIINNTDYNLQVTIATDNENHKTDIGSFCNSINISLANIEIFKEISDCFSFITQERENPVTKILLVTSEIFEAKNNIDDILSIIKGRELSKESDTALRFIAEINYEKYMPVINMLGLKDILFPNYFIMGYLALLSEIPERLEIYNQLIDYNESNISILTTEQYKMQKETSNILGVYLKNADETGNRVVLCPDIEVMQPLKKGDRLIALTSAYA